jgi:hypothetical protein
MSLRCGPHRIVALHCGKFDYAEIEIDVPAHLIGPNNVGKTSLISLLQFLYLDDQRHMQFSREMAETRRYYFPEKYSYALFECLTPTGFQVVGVHGLGPVRQHEFERFACSGRLDLADYLDEHRRMREPEDTFARLAVKGFTRLEPRHLRAALTGAGDARNVDLGLVPARHAGNYERFRKVFGNILRLSHIRQDELKQLLLDIYRHEFQQPDGIDLARNYAAGVEQVRRDSHEVQELKLLQADVERLLRHLERRDRARAVLPALWEAIGRTFLARQAGFDQEEAGLLAGQRAIEAEQAELKERLDAGHAGLRDLAGKVAVLNESITRLEEQRRRFCDFVPDWTRTRQATVQARVEELAVQLRHAADEPVEQLRKRLRTAEQNLAAKRTQLENLTHAAVNHMRRLLSDPELAAAFSVLNPAILQLPVNTDRPGLTIPDAETGAGLVRALLAHRHGPMLECRGVQLDLSALGAPNLAEYRDPVQIREDVAVLEHDVRRYTATLEAARLAEALRAEKSALEQELTGLIRDLAAYEDFCVEAARQTALEEERTTLYARQRDLHESLADQERRRAELLESGQKNRAARAELAQARAALLAQRQALLPPSETWPLQPVEDLPVEWGELGAHYRKAHDEERNQSDQVSELLDTIERRTYGRYTAGTEAETVQALRDQLESIPQRERAVEEMWKGLAVGIKKDLQNIGKDLETLKGLVSVLNRQLAMASISNLASLKLLVAEWPRWAKLIREITVDDELPLFGNPKVAEAAFEGIGHLLADHPRVDLRDLFNLAFEVGTPDGTFRRHEHLDAIESNGTTTAIKVLVNLVLLRGLLGGADVQVPFYLDECSSLDHDNLTAIVHTARRMGFIAILASPEAMDAAEKLYFLEEQPGGRVILDPKTALVRIQRQRAEVGGTADA